MRISEAFLHKPLLIVYICAGDPSPEATVDLAKRIAEAGADIIELGLPHSDPIADGPTIQAAAQRAIAAGMNTDVYFETVAAMDVDIPKVFMGYYNMIYARGLDKFASDCAKSGISGLIVPDLPPEEAGPLREACIDHGVDLIFLVAPNTPLDRMQNDPGPDLGVRLPGGENRCHRGQERCAPGYQEPDSQGSRGRSQGGWFWHFDACSSGRGDQSWGGCCHRGVGLR